MVVGGLGVGGVVDVRVEDVVDEVVVVGVIWYLIVRVADQTSSIVAVVVSIVLLEVYSRHGA